MAIQQYVQKVGAHPSQETRPCGPNPQKPTVAPDSQPPSGRKRKRRALWPEHKTSQSASSGRSKPQSKRQKTSSNSTVGSPTHTSSFSSWDRAERDYWDSLSRLHLTPNALYELDRRNDLLYIDVPPAPNGSININLEQHSADLTRFARHGGPDLSEIRNIPDPFSEDSAFSSAMPQYRKGKAKPKRKPDSKSEGKTEKRSSAYDDNFEQHLIDNNVFPARRAQRSANHAEWSEVLKRPRLSPSRSSDASYLSFVGAADDLHDEAEVMTQALPRIVGKSKHATASNVPFRNLDQITQKIVFPQPDWYQGETPGQGNRTLRERLDNTIVPSRRKERPFLPTYFAEAKGPDGSYAVARRQACHDGAIGSRAMHSLQSLGGTGDYDGKAYAASALYLSDGDLKFYTHHMTQPRGPGTLPHTHMTPLKTFNLMDDPQSFRAGRTAFRNLGDKAHEYRVQFINDAHRRNGIVSPPPPTIRSRSSHTPPSFQASVAEETDSSDSDKSDQVESPDESPIGKAYKTKTVSPSPKRASKKGLYPEPTTRRRKHTRESSGSEPGNESDGETSAPRGRQA